MKPRTLLLIDDDADLRASLGDGLRSPQLEVLEAGDVASGLAVCRSRWVDLVLLDQNLPDGTGVSLCPRILEQNENTKIVFMTAYPSFEHAVAAIRAGACDYLAKPFSLDEVELAVAKALNLCRLEAIEVEHRSCSALLPTGGALVAESRAMVDLMNLAQVAAVSDASVLIVGETGTGKSHLARYIHDHGARRGEPFVPLNCGALPESLAESELLGHERGAFTGANMARRGVFELAARGTVLLDEIGTMPLLLQPKLLSVLEEGTLRRLGGETVRTVQARVLAASNARLEAEVAAGRFRADLYFRLCVLRLEIPPLRERRGELGRLCEELLARLAGRRVELAPGELTRLEQYDWPGNVRELRNVLERALLLQRGGALRPSALLAVGPRAAAGAATAASAPLSAAESLTLAAVESQHLRSVLAACGGNQTHAARRLGIALSTLKRKLQALS